MVSPLHTNKKQNNRQLGHKRSQNKIKTMTKTTGLSITLVFGKYGGFYVKFTSITWRICLGWVALTIYPQDDIEEIITYLNNLRKNAHN